MWYAWKVTQGGVYQIDTCGSSFSPSVTAYSGSAVTALTPLASNTISVFCNGNFVPALQVNVPGNGAIVYIAVDGGVPSNPVEGSITLHWGAERLTSPPAAGNAARGCTRRVFLQRGRPGQDQSLQQQWFEPDYLVHGHVKSGWRHCHGPAERDYSERPLAPANDNFNNVRIVTTVNASLSCTNVNATTEAGEPGSGGTSVWYVWSAEDRHLRRQLHAAG